MVSLTPRREGVSGLSLLAVQPPVQPRLRWLVPRAASGLQTLLPFPAWPELLEAGHRVGIAEEREVRAVREFDVVALSRGSAAEIPEIEDDADLAPREPPHG